MQTSLTVLACARSFYLINMTLYIMASVQIAQLNRRRRLKTHASFLSVNPESPDSRFVLCSQAAYRSNAHPYLQNAMCMWVCVRSIFLPLENRSTQKHETSSKLRVCLDRFMNWLNLLPASRGRIRRS